MSIELINKVKELIQLQEEGEYYARCEVANELETMVNDHNTNKFQSLLDLINDNSFEGLDSRDGWSLDGNGWLKCTLKVSHGDPIEIIFHEHDYNMIILEAGKS